MQKKIKHKRYDTSTWTRRGVEARADRFDYSFKPMDHVTWMTQIEIFLFILRVRDARILGNISQRPSIVGRGPRRSPLARSPAGPAARASSEIIIFKQLLRRGYCAAAAAAIVTVTAQCRGQCLPAHLHSQVLLH